MTASPSSLLDFPDDNRLARAYFIEANRHLEDAFLLHTSGRYAGSLTSTLKAIELCLKSILILEGARSWVDLNQHEIFTKIISDRPLFGKLQHAINTYDSALPGEIKAIEKLVPQNKKSASWNLMLPLTPNVLSLPEPLPLHLTTTISSRQLFFSTHKQAKFSIGFCIFSRHYRRFRLVSPAGASPFAQTCRPE